MTERGGSKGVQKSGCGYSIDFTVGIAVFIFDTYAHVCCRDNMCIALLFASYPMVSYLYMFNVAATSTGLFHSFLP